MMEAAHGPEHPQVVVALNGLAQVLCFLDNFPLARSTAERREDQRGLVVPPEVAASLYQLGHVLKEQNDLGAAQSTLESSLAIFEASLGHNHKH
jgi:hypothetical protein